MGFFTRRKAAALLSTTLSGSGKLGRRSEEAAAGAMSSLTISSRSGSGVWLTSRHTSSYTASICLSGLLKMLSMLLSSKPLVEAGLEERQVSRRGRVQDGDSSSGGW